METDSDFKLSKDLDELDEDFDKGELAARAPAANSTTRVANQRSVIDFTLFDGNIEGMVDSHTKRYSAAVKTGKVEEWEAAAVGASIGAEANVSSIQQVFSLSLSTDGGSVDGDESVFLGQGTSPPRRASI